MRLGLALSVTLLSAGWSSVALAQGYGSQPQYSGQPPGGQQGSGLESGGLAPPSPMEQPPESAQTEEQLAEAEEEDKGRGLEFFYLDVEGGFEHLGLETFKADKLGVQTTKQTGWMVGAGLGLRVIFLTIGPRFRLASFSDYQLWTLNGELGLHIPLGNLEPYFTLGGGYASLGSFSAGNIGAGLNSKDVQITGYNIRAGGGLDYYVTPVFSVGASVSWELLGLARPGVDPNKLSGSGQAGAAGAQAALYAADGSSLGSAFTGSIVLGLHF